MATGISGSSDVLNEDEVEVYEVDPTHPARPMEVVVREDGNHWLCDKGVNREGDLAAQGCWRCGDFPFTRQD
jgi:streptogramin lyase